MSKVLEIRMQKSASVWGWCLYEHLEYGMWTRAAGTTPDYDEACRMAKIAWEQHSEAVSD